MELNLDWKSAEWLPDFVPSENTIIVIWVIVEVVIDNMDEQIPLIKLQWT